MAPGVSEFHCYVMTLRGSDRGLCLRYVMLNSTHVANLFDEEMIEQDQPKPRAHECARKIDKLIEHGHSCMSLSWR